MSIFFAYPVNFMRALFILISLFFCVSSYAQTSTTANLNNSANDQNPDEMVKQFSLLHQQLMPKVAVADMYYGCELTQSKQYSFRQLIIEMDKTELAEKLVACLGEETLASDRALNLGILACFIDQTNHLPEQEQQQHLEQVKNALYNLPRAERQKSFTQCVNNQTLKYLSE